MRVIWLRFNKIQTDRKGVKSELKIVYVDTATDGHHKKYLKGIMKNNNTNILVLPEKIKEFNCKQYIFNKIDMRHKNLFSFGKWMSEINQYIQYENPDIVHFVYGDDFYKVFGLGLSRFTGLNTVMTMHGLRGGGLGIISLKMISRNVDKIVVHTSEIEKILKKHSINNVEHIEYPYFGIKAVDKSTALSYYHLKKDTPVVACIGNTRYDKGLDLLLKALDNVQEGFQLLIAGKPETFDEQYIKEGIKNYAASVRMHLSYLTDDELQYALNAADIIALPYRKIFTGASGPLGEGVALKKIIVGPNHGSIGDIISRNHLGYTFESENVTSLAKVINKALNEKFIYDETAEKYRKSLSVENFIEKYEKLYNEVSMK